MPEEDEGADEQGFFERVADKILGGNDGQEGGEGWLSNHLAWMNKDDLLRYAAWFAGIAAAVFVLYLFWRQALSVLGFVFKVLLALTKALFGFLVPVAATIFGLMMTPIGMAAAAIIAVVVYVLWKMWVM